MRLSRLFGPGRAGDTTPRKTSAVAAMSVLVAMVPASIVLTPVAARASSFTPSNFVSFTLQGCQQDGPHAGHVPLPNGDGVFVCPDNAYTTGNLAKGWNELDLVPHRLTTTAGNQAGVTTSYDVYIAADSVTSGDTGYDVISAPTVNGTSDGSCHVTAGAQTTAGTASTPFGGGTDTVIYRQLSIVQSPGTTCVFDYYQRLGLGSHNYPGSSLQSYMFAQAGLSGSKKTLSIPVNAILPPSVSNDTTATQGQANDWNLTKTSEPTALDFGDTCNPGAAGLSRSVSVTVTWTKLAAAPSGALHVVANVYVTNNASRSITADVINTIRSGTAALTAGAGSADSNPKERVFSVDGASTELAFTQDIFVPSGTTDINSYAVVTFSDTYTGIPIPGSIDHTSAATYQTGTTSQTSATITDDSSITGTGFTYSIDSVTGTGSSGGALTYVAGGAAYTAGTATNQAVRWTSSTRSPTVGSSESAVIAETVLLDQARITTGTLSDTASLASGTLSRTQSASTSLTASATVSITVSKVMSLTFATDKTFSFTASGIDSADQPTTGSTSVTIPAGQAGPVTSTITGLEPGVSYTLTEPAVAPFPGLSNDNYPPDAIPVTAIALPTCSVTVPVTNTASPATARVQKVTTPTGSSSWTMTLTGVEPDGVTAVSDLGTGTATSEARTVTANAGYQLFTSNLDQDGATYTITETSQPGWDLTSVAGDFGGVSSRVTTDTTTRTCSFTLDLSNDSAKALSCTFTNTERGSITIIKNAVPDDSQTFGYTTSSNLSPTSFSLYDDGVTAGANTRSFTDLQAGQNFTVTEGAEPTHWDFTSLLCAGTNTGGTASTIDTAGTAARITLGAGDSVTCTYTNTKQGHVTLVKKENGGTPTHSYEFVLSQGGTTISDQLTDSAGNIDFGWHAPGTYTLCEVNIPAGTSSDWGTFSAATDSSCGTFTLTAGQALELDVNNTLPQGNALTIGYWKHWNSCTLATNPGSGWAKTGNTLMDALLSGGIPLGTQFSVTNCTQGVSVLSNASSKYAENQLAAQLLAAELNVRAGAHHSTYIDAVIQHANYLLSEIGYTGPPSALVGTKGTWSGLRTDFVNTASILNNYNNDLII